MGRPLRTEGKIHLQARAYSRALARLRERHKKEFARLYQEARIEVGLDRTTG